MKKLLLIFSIFTITTLPAFGGKRDNCENAVIFSNVSDWPAEYKQKANDFLDTPLDKSFESEYFTGVGCKAVCKAGQKLSDCVTPKENKDECARLFAEQKMKDEYTQQFQQELCGYIPEDEKSDPRNMKQDNKISYWIEYKKNYDTNNTPKTASTGTTSAETITVTGTVLYDDGEPATGTIVQQISNPDNATTVDIDGKFTLENISKGEKIKIHMMTYKDEEIIASTTPIEITLESGNTTLNEAIIIACKPNNEVKNGTSHNKKCYPTECQTGYYLADSNDKPFSFPDGCLAPNGQIDFDSCPQILTDCWDEDNNTFVTSRKCALNTLKCKKLKQCNETDKTALESNGASKTGIKESTNTCIALECKCGYDLNNGECVKWAEKAPCDDKNEPKLPKNAASGKKMCDDKGKAYCEIGTCNDGFKVSENKKSCISTRGDACDATAVDKNATAGVQKMVDGKMTCVITDCARGFKPNKDGTKCVAGELSEEDSQARINELRDNAKAMKDKEQSTANKLLGAAGIGATGIGGMQMMSAMAEEKSDADAERAMRAYLATFHCEYGGGKNIAGGKTDIELPGGNELINLYSEYVNLANDIKVRKTALDMRPGIESEPILDAATSGLYDDVAVGKTTGAYTSLARALMDPTGEDAKKWQEQKQSTADQKKTGMITAGVGAAGSLIGNLAINSGDSKKNKVDEILDKYKGKKNEPVAEAGTLTENMSQANESNAPVVTSDIPTDNLQERNIAQSIEISEGTTKTLTMPVSKMFDNKNKLTNIAETEISKLLNKITGDACLLATEYRHDREDFDTFYPRVKELEKHLLSELSEIKDKSTQIDPTSSIIGAGECASTNNDCPKVTILLKCIKKDKIIPSNTAETEWQELKDNEYATLGDTIYQSSTHDTYKEYLTRAENACKTAKGAWENKRRVFTYIPNTAGTYNTYFHPVCKFNTEDQSPGSTRCKKMCDNEKIKCTQGGAFGHGNYTSCLILAPETN